jgi:hypothetical protein
VGVGTKGLRPLEPRTNSLSPYRTWRALATSPYKSPVEWFVIPSVRVLICPIASLPVMAMRVRK